MTIAWILYVLLVGTLLALGAGAVASALSLAGRSTRWVWAASLLGVAVLAAAAPRATSLRMVATEEAAAPAASPAAAAPAPMDDLAAAVRSARLMVAATTVRVIAAVGARVPGVATRPVVIGWVVASTLLLSIYLLVNLRLARARQRWPRERLQGIDVRVAPAAGPAVIGMVHPEIVVPRSLLEREAEQQRMIVEHEDEHLRARDHLLLAFACLAVIVLPWHPAVWYVLARLRLAIELDCDARVLRRGAAPRSYGALLIDMASHGAGIRVGTLALADRPSHLERRLLAMRATRSRFVLVRAGALCAIAALLTLAACEAKLPTSAELTEMDMAAVEKAAVSAKFSERFDKADYFINGVRVTSEDARALDAKSIGSVEVVKGGRDTIFVTTVDRMIGQDSTRLLGVKVRSMSGADESGQPAVFIDKVATTHAVLAKLRGEDIAAIQVLKPGADAKYPTGALLIDMKRPGETRVMYPKVPSNTSVKITRTDSVRVHSERGLARASALWSDSAVARLGPDERRRVVLVPGKEEDGEASIRSRPCA
jgi:beta-lactamase regulating signal transducer with metallopeptidase domain